MRNVFLRFCSALTGFSAAELEGSGLVDAYQDLLDTTLGFELAAKFYVLAASVVSAGSDTAQADRIVAQVLPDPVFWPVAEGLLTLWYVGWWKALPNDWYTAQNLPVPSAGNSGLAHVPFASAYTEQLSYRAASAHPPGVKPTGYGSWSLPPVF